MLEKDAAQVINLTPVGGLIEKLKTVGNSYGELGC
jgi:hypothetical protein